MSEIHIYMNYVRDINLTTKRVAMHLEYALRIYSAYINGFSDLWSYYLVY